MISIDFESGQIFIGEQSAPVRLTDNQGYLHLNPPDGPVLRALSVLERLRLIQHAMTAENGPASLAASILHEATVKPGVGDYRMHEAVALYLAGGGLKAPPIYRSISMVARHTGWGSDEIFSAEAAQIDRMSSALTPSPSSEWKRVLMLDTGQDELDAYTNDLAASLLNRMDDSESGVFGDEGQSQVDEKPAPQTKSTVDNSGGLKSADKTGGLRADAADEQRRSPKNQEKGSNSSRMKISDRFSKESKPFDMKSGSSRNGPRGKKISEPSEIGTNANAELAKPRKPKKSTVSADGFSIKKQNRQRLETEVGRKNKEVRTKKLPPLKDGPKSTLSRPQPAAADSKHGLQAEVKYKPVRKKKKGDELVFKRHSGQPGNIRSKSETYKIGTQPEDIPVHGIADEISDDKNRLLDRPRNDRHPAGPDVRRLPPLSQHGATETAASSLDRQIASFFGHRETSVADELAESLNREADLRGLN